MIDGEPAWLVGRAADDTWRRAQAVKAEGLLSCRGCGGTMHTRTSPLGTRFFAHNAGRPGHCLFSEAESKEHIAAKLAVAEAIEACGGVALVEDIAQDRSFIVDATGVWTLEDGRTRRVAFEVQCSPQNADTTRLRNRQRKAECDLTVWVLYARPTPTTPEVPVLDLPLWARGWAPELPHLRIHEDLTTVGMVASEVVAKDDESPQAAWRPSTLVEVVGAIGRERCVWSRDEPYSEAGGWVTARTAWDLQQAMLDWRQHLEEQRNAEAAARAKFEAEMAKERERQEELARQQAEKNARLARMAELRARRERREWFIRHKQRTAEEIDAERRELTNRLVGDLKRRSIAASVEDGGWANTLAIHTEGLRLLIMPDPNEVPASGKAGPARQIVVGGGLRADYRHLGEVIDQIRWLTHFEAITVATQHRDRRHSEQEREMRAKARELRLAERRRELVRGAREALLPNQD